MKRAIFFDIDGTLIDCMHGMNDMSVEVKRAIRQLQLEGDLVFIATGRPYAFLSKEILEFGFDGFVLTNGAQVMLNEKTIYKQTMESSFIKALVEKCKEHQIQYILEEEYYAYLPREFEEFYNFYDKVGIGKKLIKDEFDLDELEVQKVEIRCLNKEDRAHCIDFLKQHPSYDHFESIDERHMEIYCKKNTKARGIMETLNLIQIPIENSFAFGDGSNDVEMLEAVGCGIAMGNASDEVKTYANEVTDTVLNDGVALGIKKYILNQDDKKIEA